MPFINIHNASYVSAIGSILYYLIYLMPFQLITQEKHNYSILLSLLPEYSSLLYSTLFHNIKYKCKFANLI